MTSEYGGRNVGTLMLGGILVALGILFLFGQFLDVNLGALAWPLYIIVPGIALCAIGLSVRGGGGEAALIVGSMVTMTGLLLAYQNATNHWESWAYAWALVAPTSIGLAQLVYGQLMNRPDMVKTGKSVTTVGMVIFLGGAVFFELVVGISGRSAGHLGSYVIPLALIALGAWMLYISPRSSRGQA